MKIEEMRSYLKEEKERLRMMEEAILVGASERDLMDMIQKVQFLTDKRAFVAELQVQIDRLWRRLPTEGDTLL